MNVNNCQMEIFTFDYVIDWSRGKKIRDLNYNKQENQFINQILIKTFILYL